MTTMNTNPPATYASSQVSAALGTMYGLLDAAADTSDIGDFGTATRAALRMLGDGPYTYEQVSQALNAAADVMDPMENGAMEYSDTLFIKNVLNLAVNVAGHVLAHPDSTLDDAIAAAWTDLDDDELSFAVLDELPEGTPVPERGTPERDAMIVATVLGWVDE
jgi:hypothetical protein